MYVDSTLVSAGHLHFEMNNVAPMLWVEHIIPMVHGHVSMWIQHLVECLIKLPLNT